MIHQRVETRVLHLFAGSNPSLLPVCWTRMLLNFPASRYRFKVLLARKSDLPEDLRDAAAQKGIEIEEIPALADAGDRLYAFRLRHRLKRVIRQWETNLIHAHHVQAVAPTVQCLRSFPGVAVVHSLHFDSDSLGIGVLQGQWRRRRLSRRLLRSGRIIVRDKYEEEMIRELGIVERYQVEEIGLGIDVDALREMEPPGVIPDLFESSDPEYRLGVLIPDVGKVPFKQFLISLRDLFDVSDRTTVWCLVPIRHISDVAKTIRRLRFPDRFQLVGGILPWEWVGSRIKAGWIPGEDADSETAACISSAFGIPVLRYGGAKSKGDKQSAFHSGAQSLKDLITEPALAERQVDPKLRPKSVSDVVHLLAKCYVDVLKEGLRDYA